MKEKKNKKSRKRSRRRGGGGGGDENKRLGMKGVLMVKTTTSYSVISQPVQLPQGDYDDIGDDDDVE